MENEPGFLFDAVVLPEGDEAVSALAANGLTAEFVQNVYRHCKPLVAFGASTSLLDSLGISPQLPDGRADEGVVFSTNYRNTEDTVKAFLSALMRHRHFERETDPPAV
jgi:catalase